MHLKSTSGHRAIESRSRFFQWGVACAFHDHSLHAAFSADDDRTIRPSQMSLMSPTLAAHILRMRAEPEESSALPIPTAHGVIGSILSITVPHAWYRLHALSNETLLAFALREAGGHAPAGQGEVATVVNVGCPVCVSKDRPVAAHDSRSSKSAPV